MRPISLALLSVLVLGISACSKSSSSSSTVPDDSMAVETMANGTPVKVTCNQTTVYQGEGVDGKMYHYREEVTMAYKGKHLIKDEGDTEAWILSGEVVGNTYSADTGAFLSRDHFNYSKQSHSTKKMTIDGKIQEIGSSKVVRTGLDGMTFHGKPSETQGYSFENISQKNGNTLTVLQAKVNGVVDKMAPYFVTTTEGTPDAETETTTFQGSFTDDDGTVYESMTTVCRTEAI